MLLVRPGGQTQPRRPVERGSAPLAGGVGSAVGFGGGIVAALLTAVLGAHGTDPVAYALFAFVVAAVAALTTPAGAVAAAIQCWGFWDGFLVNDFGTLSVDHVGLRELVLLTSLTLLANLGGSAWRRLTASHGGTRDDDRAGIHAGDRARRSAVRLGHN